MAEFISCRNCDSPYCNGCNIYTLATMLQAGKFDCLMDENRSVNRFADVAPVVHGKWVLTAHEEYSNCRWHVTAECSECHHDKGEIYAGFFPGFPKDLARGVVLDCAESVKLDNYCPNCGADMRERKGDDELSRNDKF